MNYIVNTARTAMVVLPDNSITIRLHPDGPLFAVSEQAHRGIAMGCKVPWKYYERMLERAPGLLRQTVHTWWNLPRTDRDVTVAEGEGMRTIVAWELAKASRVA